MTRKMRLGRIGYLNVLPIYHPLEKGLIDHDLEIVSGPPSHLNRLMRSGELDVSAASSIEYARNPEQYLLVPDLAIGSCGPVMSVLLLSRNPVEQLNGEEILVSSQTHTSAALLRILLSERYKLECNNRTGDATELLAEGERPEAILAIGDEALNLRNHVDYPHTLDLGEAWREWTGLPFIFGVWIVQRDCAEMFREGCREICDKLSQARDWGVENMPDMCLLASQHSSMGHKDMCSYFDGLSYALGPDERKGLETFFKLLEKCGFIDHAPKLEFF